MRKPKLMLEMQLSAMRMLHIPMQLKLKQQQLIKTKLTLDIKSNLKRTLKITQNITLKLDTKLKPKLKMKQELEAEAEAKHEDKLKQQLKQMPALKLQMMLRLQAG